MSRTDFRLQRESLSERTLRRRGIKSETVLRAMLQVPREEFVAEEMRKDSYRDAPLPIGEGQTISQPYVVALMVEQLNLSPDDRVLEVGTGSGYAAAILSLIAKEVYSIERHEKLAKSAQATLRRLGYQNVEVLHGDGTLGWPEQAPFDAIIISAGGPLVPPAILRQLRIGGRLVMPVGEERHVQNLIRLIRRRESEFDYQELGGVSFVPLIGEQGWREDDNGKSWTETLPKPEEAIPDPMNLKGVVFDVADPMNSRGFVTQREEEFEAPECPRLRWS